MSNSCKTVCTDYIVGTLATRSPHKHIYSPFQGQAQYLHKPTQRPFSGPKSNLFRAPLSGPDQSQVSLFSPIIGQFNLTNHRRNTNPADRVKRGRVDSFWCVAFGGIYLSGGRSSPREQPQCCGCGGNHTANYRGCVKWKEAKAALAKKHLIAAERASP